MMLLKTSKSRVISYQMIIGSRRDLTESYSLKKKVKSKKNRSKETRFHGSKTLMPK